MTERVNRVFTDYTRDPAKALFEESGLEIIECEETDDVRPGREGEKWVNVIARKK